MQEEQRCVRVSVCGHVSSVSSHVSLVTLARTVYVRFTHWLQRLRKGQRRIIRSVLRDLIKLPQPSSWRSKTGRNLIPAVITGH